MEFEGFSGPFSGCDGGSDFYLLFIFLRNKKIMIAPSVVSKEAKDIRSSCITKDHILFFRKKNGDVFFSRWKDGHLGGLSPLEKVTMVVPFESPSPYFYFFLPLTRNMRDLFPFSPFPRKVLWILNVAPLKLICNSWDLIRVFKMVCEGMEIPPTAGIFFSFYVNVYEPQVHGWVK